MLGEKEVAESVDCYVMVKTLERMLWFVRKSFFLVLHEMQEK